MKFDKSRIITWLLLSFILIGLFNIYTLIKDRDRIYESIESSVYARLKDSFVTPKDGDRGYSPVKGVDYFDGRDGRDGKDGTNGKDGIDGQDGVDGAQGIQGEKGDPGQDGYTPQLRCNQKKNQWEVRYTDDGNWELLNNEKVKCTIGL